MINTKSLVQALNKMMKDSTVGQEARVQVKLPRGEYHSPDGYFDIARVSLIENNVVGHRETHRIVLEISTQESWLMGKPKRTV